MHRLLRLWTILCYCSTQLFQERPGLNYLRAGPCNQIHAAPSAAGISREHRSMLHVSKYIAVCTPAPLMIAGTLDVRFVILHRPQTTRQHFRVCCFVSVRYGSKQRRDVLPTACRFAICIMCVCVCGRGENSSIVRPPTEIYRTQLL